MKAYVLSVRPKTLVAAVVPIVSAAVLALFEQKNIPIYIFFCALLCALALQIATNLFNDLVDFKKGADDHNRIGPKRVTQSGLMSEKQVLFVAIIFLFITVLSGIPLLIVGGWPFLVLGLISLFLAYGYTGGPFPLAYLGLGDVFVILFFGLVAVCGSYYLFTGAVSEASVIFGAQVGCLATVLIAINNLRDSITDANVEKKTLAVRFGDNFVKAEIIGLIFTSFILVYYWWSQYQKYYFLLVFLSLPLACYISYNIWENRDKADLNRMLGLSGALLFVFCALQWVALLL